MGLFGLTGKEKAIWKTIRPLDTAKIKVGNTPQTYITKVADVDDKSITLQTPIVGAYFLELHENDPIHVEIYTPDGGRIKFVSRVVSQEWLRDKVTKLSLPRSVEKVQLRAYYRLEIVLDVEYSLIEGREASSESLDLKLPVYVGLTKDISEGGVLLIVDKVIAKGSIMNMKVKLPSGEIIRTRGKVLRIEELSVRGKYGLGIEFMKVPDEDREKLRKFIFKRARERYLRMR